MYKPNTSHFQQDIFASEMFLPKKKFEKLKHSKEYSFYKLIFCNINEDLFSVLYSDKKSRPNAPINAMVSSLILLQQKSWTYEQLLDQIDFDLKTRMALGLHSFADTPFSESTLFDFQLKVNDYWIKEGINLFEVVFDALTEKQLKELKLKTNIQRSDSFLAASNIRTYSRVQLLVEVLIRLHRILSEEDQVRYADLLSPYVKKTSNKFIYSLKREDIPHALEELGNVYYELHRAFKPHYGDREVFQIFQRVYEEHFTFVPAGRTGGEEKVTIKTTKELNSGMLQSPDDIDATYRKKRDQKSKGHVINVSETAHPDNPLNLITDVAVEKNNVDDSELLNKRIDKMKEKTPDLDELHTDGGYGSEDNDEKMEEEKITHIQTAVRGRESEVPMEIEQLPARQSGGEENIYSVICPTQQVASKPTRKRYKACFNVQVCNGCELKDVCPSVEQKRQPYRVYYFAHEDFLLDKRRRAITKIPKERRKIRPNVEATVKEFTSGMNHKGKLKVRGTFKTEAYAFTTAISINFGRIYRYMTDNSGKQNIWLLRYTSFLPVIELLRNLIRLQVRFFGKNQESYN